jgi:hypothetical protein
MSLNWFSATIDVPVLVLKAATIDVPEPVPVEVPEHVPVEVPEPVPVEVPDEIKIPGEKRSHIYQKKEPQEDVKDTPEKILITSQSREDRKSATTAHKKEVTKASSTLTNSKE